jgi:peptidoglycan/LPS O-acetylase OafA/YrhL
MIGGVEGLRRIRGWSRDEQFTLASAVALVIGPLLPWVDFAKGTGFSERTSGIELNAGLLCLVVGVVAVWVLNRPKGPQAAATSGALTALALLGGILVLVALIQHWSDPVAPLWGLFVTGLGALALLVGSFLIQGETDESLGPPD